MHKVKSDFIGDSGLVRKKGEILDLLPDKVIEYKNFIEPVEIKKKIEVEKAIIGESVEKAILEKPKKKGTK